MTIPRELIPRITLALSAAHAALISYEFGNASPVLAEEIAEMLRDVMIDWFVAMPDDDEIFAECRRQGSQPRQVAEQVKLLFEKAMERSKNGAKR